MLLEKKKKKKEHHEGGVEEGFACDRSLAHTIRPRRSSCRGYLATLSVELHLVSIVRLASSQDTKVVPFNRAYAP